MWNTIKLQYKHIDTYIVFTIWRICALVQSFHKNEGVQVVTFCGGSLFRGSLRSFSHQVMNLAAVITHRFSQQR